MEGRPGERAVCAQPGHCHCCLTLGRHWASAPLLRGRLCGCAFKRLPRRKRHVMLRTVALEALAGKLARGLKARGPRRGPPVNQAGMSNPSPTLTDLLWPWESPDSLKTPCTSLKIIQHTHTHKHRHAHSHIHTLRCHTYSHPQTRSLTFTITHTHIRTCTWTHRHKLTPTHRRTHSYTPSQTHITIMHTHTRTLILTCTPEHTQTHPYALTYTLTQCTHCHTQ